MKPYVAALVLCPWLALSAWSQTTTFAPQQALPQVRQFLGLTDSQVTTILQNNNDYNAFSFQQQRQIQNAQSQIAVETAKDSLDPMAIGTLYAGIESACRDLRDKAATSMKQNLSILTDAQKAKLTLLNDAIKLAPIISQAESGDLLGSTGSPPLFFITESLPVTTRFIPNLVSGVSGCGVTISGLGFGGILSPVPIPPPPAQPGVAGMNTTPAPANRTVNQWFDRTDFYRGGFETLTKPQAKPQ